MCKCIEYLAVHQFVERNLVKNGQYLLSSANKKNKELMVVIFCPNCGEQLVSKASEAKP